MSRLKEIFRFKVKDDSISIGWLNFTRNSYLLEDPTLMKSAAPMNTKSASPSFLVYTL